jgi:hypothetical protein
MAPFLNTVTSGSFGGRKRNTVLGFQYSTAWITNSSLGTWSWSNGASSSVTLKGTLFNTNFNDGSPSAPAGNPGSVRYTFTGGLTDYTKVRIYCNTHDDGYAYRRVYYNGPSGTGSIITGGNTTSWYDITSSLGGTFNWVEWGNYGGGDGGRTPSGLLAIEVNDQILIDPQASSYGG